MIGYTMLFPDVGLYMNNIIITHRTIGHDAYIFWQNVGYDISNMRVKAVHNLCTGDITNTVKNAKHITSILIEMRSWYYCFPWWDPSLTLVINYTG